MVIKFIKTSVVIVTFALLLPRCNKDNVGCPKQGYEYIHENSFCYYMPASDSIQVGDTITLEASLPKTFIDEKTNKTVTNTASEIEGPLGIGMIYPTYQAAVDSFELIAHTGKIIKDTQQFSEGMLKGFRTIQWDASPIDSFKIKISIRALAKGTYAFALKQQTAKDKDCALYKYFLSPGNTNQHLNYWIDVFGNASDIVAFYTYCIKIY
ncbi:MAG TPA: hypothetical protein VKB95_03900 [Chitinophagaceae bacterium]|nr:hypothetical protein [Chitinophagaceae bacterium]